MQVMRREGPDGSEPRVLGEESLQKFFCLISVAGARGPTRRGNAARGGAVCVPAGGSPNGREVLGRRPPRSGSAATPSSLKSRGGPPALGDGRTCSYGPHRSAAWDASDTGGLGSPGGPPRSPSRALAGVHPRPGRLFSSPGRQWALGSCFGWVSVAGACFPTSPYERPLMGTVSWAVPGARRPRPGRLELHPDSICSFSAGWGLG